MTVTGNKGDPFGLAQRGQGAQDFFQPGTNGNRPFFRFGLHGKGQGVIEQVVDGPDGGQHPGGDPLIVGIVTQVAAQHRGVKFQPSQGVPQLLTQKNRHILDGGKTLTAIEMSFNHGRIGHILQGEEKTAHIEKRTLQLIAGDEQVTMAGSAFAFAGLIHQQAAAGAAQGEHIGGLQSQRTPQQLPAGTALDRTSDQPQQGGGLAVGGQQSPLAIGQQQAPGDTLDHREKKLPQLIGFVK